MVVKITAEVIAERMEGRPFKLISYGGRMAAKSTFACSVPNCGYVWETTLNSICSNNTGCLRCKGLEPLSADEAHKRLHGRGLVMLEYGGTTSARAKFKCLKDACGREWRTSFSNVDYMKKGCPSCAGVEAIPESKVIERLKGRPIKLLRYAGTCSKHSLFMCLNKDCGHEWSASGRDILNGGKGCPACADYGFNPSKPADFYIYLITNKGVDYLGFGITRRLEGRNDYHERTFLRAGVDAVLLDTYRMSGLSAQQYERKLKATLPIEDSGVPGFRTEAVLFDHPLYTRISEGARDLADDNQINTIQCIKTKPATLSNI